MTIADKIRLKDLEKLVNMSADYHACNMYARAEFLERIYEAIRDQIEEDNSGVADD